MGQECLSLYPYWMGVGMVLCQTMYTMGALHCLGLAPPSDPKDQCKKKKIKKKLQFESRSMDGVHTFTIM